LLSYRYPQPHSPPCRVFRRDRALSSGTAAQSIAGSVLRVAVLGDRRHRRCRRVSGDVPRSDSRSRRRSVSRKFGRFFLRQLRHVCRDPPRLARLYKQQSRRPMSKTAGFAFPHTRRLRVQLGAASSGIRTIVRSRRTVCLSDMRTNARMHPVSINKEPSHRNANASV
jgi:hypothetical protein